MKNRPRMLAMLCLLILLPIACPVLGNSKDWIQVGADIDGEAAGDNSGTSVSLSANGTVVAIGAIRNSGNGTNAGHVRIYRNRSGAWTQVGADIDGEAAGDYSGGSISLSADGTIVAIGAVTNADNGTNAGHVRIYKYQVDAWTQVGGDIDGEAATDLSGVSVSLSADGTIVAVGAHENDNSNGTNAGHVRIYKYESDTWTQVGTDIDGEGGADGSGWSVSLSADGTTVAIGARFNADNGTQSGHVRVYENLSGTWAQVGKDIDGEASGDQSGQSVSLSADGEIVAIGASFNAGNGTKSGHVRVYENLSGTWAQIGADIDGEAAGDYSGHSVSLSADGTIVAIGAKNNAGNGTDSGHVRIYENQSGIWVQIGVDIDGEAAGDYSGNAVSLSAHGRTVAIGARYNAGNGTNAGHVRIFENNFPWPMFLPAITLSRRR